MNKLYVIGIGYRPLDKRSREIILNSEVILASNRLLDVFKRYEEFESVKDKIKVINNVDETFDFIKSQISNPPSSPFSKGGESSPLSRGVRGVFPPLAKGGKGGFIVLLASGDPMFFGIGRRSIEEFGKDAVEILPDLSSIQVAFSKIKEPWDDALLISLHGGPDPEKRRRLEYELDDVPSLLAKYKKIAILTDKENTPAVIAEAVNSSLVTPHSSLIMFVCEKLGYPDERIIEGIPEEIVGMSFLEPNVVIIQNTEQIPLNPPLLKGPACPVGRGEGEFSEVRFGLTENKISHSRGLITKDEVRAVTIHKLRLPQNGVFWDIGSGSGSVSIEIARLYPELKVFAIERDKEQIENIKKNKIKFNTPNIKIIEGEAPEVLADIPPPNRVFTGGSRGRLNEIIELTKQKMTSGIIVINATAIETLNEAIQCLENNGFDIEMSEVSVSRSKVIGGKKHLGALNPVFLISGEKMQ